MLILPVWSHAVVAPNPVKITEAAETEDDDIEVIGKSIPSNFVAPPPPPESVEPARAISQARQLAAIAAPVSFRPSAPTYLTAIADNAAVILSWYPSEGTQPISGYLVYRSERSDIPPVRPISKTPVRDFSFIDNEENSVAAPENRKTYTYWVRAYDVAQALSEFSEPVSASPNGPLLPPVGFKASSGDGSVELSWKHPISTGPYDLSFYRLYRATAAGTGGELLSEPGPEETGYVDSKVENRKDYFYSLRSVDQMGNESRLSQEITAAPFVPSAAPRELSAVGIGSQVVRLKWKAPEKRGSFRLDGYNIYRSTGLPVDLGLSPVNKTIVSKKAKYFDDPENSIVPPELGTQYYYVVVAVDKRGNSSGASEPVQAGPVKSLEDLAVKWDITDQSSLRISGRKTIDMGYTWPISKRKETSTSLVGVSDGFNLEQTLRVGLQGNVGRKIKVDVDYDDNKALESSEQRKISIVYTGDQQEVFKEFAFGDIFMDLSRTEFAGYNKSLFGAKARLESPDGTLNFTAIGAQTKGFTETKTIIGDLEEVKTGTKPGKLISDSLFAPWRYYYLSRRDDLINGDYRIRNGSVQIWVDTNRSSDIVSAARKEIAPAWVFNRLNIGTDYTVDLATGLITFNIPIQDTYSIAVVYDLLSGDGSLVERVGNNKPTSDLSEPDFNPTDAILHSNSTIPGLTTSSDILIQNGKGSRVDYDAHMAFEYYNLGNRDIAIDEFFEINIMNKTSNLIYTINEKNYQSFIELDQALGLLHFRSPFPFKQPSAGSPAPGLFAGNNPGNFTGANNFTTNAFLPNQQDVYNKLLNASDKNNFNFEIKYRYRVSSYNLRFNIIRGSEVIVVDGRRLTRDVDYFIDYDTGILVFSRPELIHSKAVIEATYEYLPFGGAFNSTIWGLRGEYKLSDTWSVGTTFIRNDSQKPLETPDVRSTPFSLQVLDVDMKAGLDENMLTDMIKDIPLIGGWKVPLSVSTSLEGARSWFQPNTYSQAGEKGVAMVDNFENVDNIVSAGTDEDSWSPASQPLGVVETAKRRFSEWVDTDVEKGHDSENDAKTGQGPTRNLIKVRYGQFQDSEHWDSFVYVLSPTGLNLNEYTNVEMWIKTQQRIVLNIDIGVIDEDANGNLLPSPDRETNSALNDDVDIGIPLEDSPWGPAFSPQSLYTNLNYWGGKNQFADTEDLDGNGRLDRIDSFYRFTQVLSPVSDAENNDFQFVRFPLGQATALGSPAPTLNTSSKEFFNNIKHLRIWWTSPDTAAGEFRIESVQVTGNKWQLRTSDGQILQQQIVPDNNKFIVRAINRTINPSYVPNTDFFRTQEDLSDDREQSLEIEYNLDNTNTDINGNAFYLAKRVLTTATGGLDFGNYRNMRLDIYKPQATEPGEILFARLGINDTNYYQYSISLDNVPAGEWSTVTIPLGGRDGQRTTVGEPYLRNVGQMVIGILSLNPPNQSSREKIYLNNLRLTDAIERVGDAVKASVTYNLGAGKFVLNQDLREVDSDFIQIDRQSDPPKAHETSHKLRGDLKLLSWLPVSANWDHSVYKTEENRINDPAYSNNFNNPDTTSDNVSGTITFSLIKNLGITSRANFSRIRRNYLPEYVETQRELYPASPGQDALDPDTTVENWSVSELANYTIPTDMWLIPKDWWLLGGDQVQVEYIYVESQTVFDVETDKAGGSFENSYKGERTQKYRYTGSWKLGTPVELAPGFASTYTDARGYLTRPAVDKSPFYLLNEDGEALGYQPQTRILQPSLNLNFQSFAGVNNPRVTYKTTTTRNYINNNLDAKGDLGLSASIDIGKWLNTAGIVNKLTPLDVRHGINVDSFYDNTEVSSIDPQLWPTTLLEDAKWHQSPYWVRLEPGRFFLDEDREMEICPEGLSECDDRDKITVPNPTNVEQIALRANRRISTQLNWNFSFNANPTLKFGLSPFLTLNNNREMASRGQGKTKKIRNWGSSLSTTPPSTGMLRYLKPSDWTLRYSRQDSVDYEASLKSDDSVNKEITRSSNSVDVKLLNRPTEKFSFTVGYLMTLSTDIRYPIPSQPEEEVTKRSAYTPSVKTTYNYRMDRPVKLWDIWPFHGRELRLTSTLQLGIDLQAQIVRDSLEKTNVNKADLVQPPSTNTYTCTVSGNYALLKNVTLDLSVRYDFYQDLIVHENDFSAITLKAGLVATF